MNKRKVTVNFIIQYEDVGIVHPNEAVMVARMTAMDHYDTCRNAMEQALEDLGATNVEVQMTAY
jgi:hypothetical protein